MNFDNNWLLSVLTFLPLVGAAVVMLIPKGEEMAIKLVALLASLGVLGLTIFLLIDFDYDNSSQLQYGVDEEWISVINSRYILGVDGMSLPLIALTALVVPLCIVYSLDHIPAPGNPKAFMSLILILQTGMIGTFVAQDLILFFVFFEVVLLPMFFMIAVWGGEDRRYASLKFFLYTMFGSALMLVSFLAMYFLADGTIVGDEANTFSMVALSEGATVSIARTSQLWIFAGMFVGFGVKVPMFPFHTWLPDAHTQAPTVGSVILAAVLLKLGTYGFIRIAIPMLPEAAAAWAPFIGLLAVIGIIYGALGCLAQSDMKRLIAFSSVAHMGFVMLGIATLTDFGVNAAIFGMVAHGLITGMLFFLAGSVKERYHTLDMGRLGGLLVSAPRMGWILGFCAMASLGLPGLAGFWGEFPAILASYEPANILPESTFRGYMVVAALGTVLAAGYLLWMYQKTAMGTPKEEFVDDPEITDVNGYEWVAWAPMLALILFLGLYPRPIFTTTDDAVVKSLTVDVQGEEVPNCLELDTEEGEACFDGLRDETVAAGN